MILREYFLKPNLPQGLWFSVNTLYNLFSELFYSRAEPEHMLQHASPMYCSTAPSTQWLSQKLI